MSAIARVKNSLTVFDKKGPFLSVRVMLDGMPGEVWATSFRDSSSALQLWHGHAIALHVDPPSVTFNAQEPNVPSALRIVDASIAKANEATHYDEIAQGRAREERRRQHDDAERELGQISARLRAL